MEISIIVSYTNTTVLLENFLAHIVPIVNHFNYELILIQDGEVYDSVEKIVSNYKKKCRNINHLRTQCTHLGYSKVNNIAAKKAKGKSLLFINTDVFPEKQAINLLYRRLSQSFSTGIVQGLLIYPQNNKVQSAGHLFGEYFNNHALVGADVKNSIIQEEKIRQGLTSAFYMIRKADFEMLNGFDEYFYNAWDGLDLSLRVTYELRKECIFYPNSKAYHTQGGSRESIFRNTSYQDAYFWNRWSKIIKKDFHLTLADQLTEDEKSQNYTILNCSSYPLRQWQPFLNKVNSKIKEEYTLERYCKSEKIVLLERFPKLLLGAISPILFLTDRVDDLACNKKTFEEMSLKNSIICDLHGNITKL